MRIEKYQVDAFAFKVFEGNPAVVCPVSEFPSSQLMQNIAMEHNLSETAFIVKDGNAYQIRWFTPMAEVELCGHATLASAFVIFEFLGYTGERILFKTKSRGDLTVTKVNGMYELDFPSTPAEASSLEFDQLQSVFNTPVVEYYEGKTDCIILLENEEAVFTVEPDMALLSKLERRGFIVTAESEKYDFVSRFFAPRVGVPEDPVTGSAHTLLIPFWANRLNKINMVAKQVSKRGGILYCTHLNERVRIAGGAVLYSKGEIILE